MASRPPFIEIPLKTDALVRKLDAIARHASGLAAELAAIDEETATAPEVGAERSDGEPTDG